MRTEDLFKYGVTPKEGENAGKRFIVDEINKDAVYCHDADNKSISKMSFAHGTYKIWEPEKTLFQDGSIKPTFGNLKKAVESAGLGDDALFVVKDSFFGVSLANFSIGTLNGKKVISVE